MQEYIFVMPTDSEYIDAIYRIMKKCGINLAKHGLFHWIPFYSRKAIRRDCGSNWVVLVRDTDLQAYTSTFQMRKNEDGSLYWRKLATTPEYEGRGIARTNFAFIEKFAKEHHCPKILLDVYARSLRAISFYEKLGFVTVGTKRTVRFKELVMEKTL